MAFFTCCWQVLDSADKEGLVLEPLKLSKGELRQRLRDLMTDWYPPATMDDFYVLLGILLCNLSCRRGSDVNRGWYQTRAKDLVGLFPNVSGEVSVRLYDEAKADAICAFAERWPHTRAAVGSVILKGRFEGPMHRLQRYVSTSWSFAGMKHAERPPLLHLDIKTPSRTTEAKKVQRQIPLPAKKVKQQTGSIEINL
ncbi:hypothetical protein HPB51_027167 [Rhipicephalus microplus]|uniref:Uncharacterized protein n=1 Tax=Rhipicephalus microplus TaxID=6941 RepID=A0A9J6D0N0_RHIMP|nr:hypothetical protein HPB51_027167 [Rhipicephalus microplus]